MTDIVRLNTCSADTFYDVLKLLRGISPIYQKIHHLLCEMQSDLSVSAQKVLYIYFSLLNEGNTRLALDCELALSRWMAQWNRLIRLAAIEDRFIPVAQSDDAVFKQILTEGIQDILNHRSCRIIEERTSKAPLNRESLTTPLVIACDGVYPYLYATRYFNAKCVIEDKCKKLFVDFDEKSLDPGLLASCQAYFEPFLKPPKPEDPPFRLADRQAEAILRGQKQNLIITGGPGTGKTTVICFLLWKLLEEDSDKLSWDIRLAAPSGKAADRMRESLLGCLGKFKDSNGNVYQKLRDLESYTLHRLLSFSPSKNQFKYNAETPFPKHTIFVIDEASMIDIDLFARFMEALPEDGCRVFILGDPDQLPSVEAGAVLGEMLRTSKFVVKLNESKRFDATSEIGKLALSIQEAKKLNGWPDSYPKPVFAPYSGMDYSLTQNNSDIIHYISLNEERKQAEEQLKSLIQNWVDAFYIGNHYIQRCNQIMVNNAGELIDSQTCERCPKKQLDELWNIAQNARILSAERQGMTGVVSLNDLVRSSLKILDFGKFYIGQLLMLTKNQSTLKLYNGDCGIVVGESSSGRLYLLLKKVRTKQSSDHKAIHDVIDYVTYPLSLLPTEDLESAFAMTIHKSQGSGYGNIMMFLPQMAGHPLLNNQMIYTGVTRTEKKSLTIVATQAAFEAGCKTVMVRDTGIDIG